MSCHHDADRGPLAWLGRWWRFAMLTLWLGRRTGPACPPPTSPHALRVHRLEPDGTLTQIHGIASVHVAWSSAVYDNVPPPAPALVELADPHDDPRAVPGECNARWGVKHRCSLPEDHDSNPAVDIAEHACPCGSMVEG